MKTIDEQHPTGLRAFPNAGGDGPGGGRYDGMTLLDWFAGQVAAAVIANPSTQGEVPADQIIQLARISYFTAAAMIAEKRRRENL